MDRATANAIGAFTTVLTSAVMLYDRMNYDPNLRPIDVPDSQLQSDYDFIIVGGGSAGSILANRLTEIANWTVLLLEAGGDETVATDTPLLSYFLRNTNVDWNYTTVPQENACQLSNGTCSWPRGRVLGGSTVLGDMFYSRGSRYDYDGWATMGNPGWSFQDVLPYFIKSEDNQDPLTMHSPYHGRGGYLSVKIPPFVTNLAQTFLNAAEEMGYPILDYNGPEQKGFMVPQGTLRGGTKCSNAKSFLRPIRNRRNLNIAMNAFVTKINFDSSNIRATGVTFARNGTNITVNARREVILSAGVVDSPKLLMLSGIGHRDHLNSIGIPLVKNLPVGDNLQDHLTIPIVFTTTKNVTFDLRTAFQNESAIFDYAMNSSGPLTSMNGGEAIGFIDWTTPPNNFRAPEAEFMISSYVPMITETERFLVVSFYLHPQSRGTIRLPNSDPYSMPLIDPKYLSEPQDIVSNVELLMFIFRYMQTQTMRNMEAQLAPEFYPLCSTNLNSTISIAQCLLHYYSMTAFHPVGTCKMGPRSDPTAVVNSRLQVYDIDNLRVIDASIMPIITSGNTGAPTSMIAERAADFIKQDHGVLAL